MDLVRGSVGDGDDVLEEHLRELAGGVVRHVSVQSRCCRTRTPPAECRVQRAEFQTRCLHPCSCSLAGSSHVQNKKTEWLPLHTDALVLLPNLKDSFKYLSK